MARYLAELYLSRDGAGDDITAVAARARAADGTQVRYLRSIFVPEDETWFLLYDAPSAAAVEEALARAGLRSERVLEAVTDTRAGLSGPSPSAPTSPPHDRPR